MADATASAPGRVNLIGEHTDYHEGYVLPTVLPQRTTTTLTRQRGRNVRVTSDGEGTAEYELGREQPRHEWIDYVMGVTWALGRRHFALDGFTADITSTVPIGAGVSSSAALEISVLRALREMMSLSIDDVELAVIGREAEVEFVGAPVGVMDQLASSLGQLGDALFIDTRTLRTERVPLPPSMRLFVVDSGITHAHASGDYRVRRRESFEASERLGLKMLRDATADDLSRASSLPWPLSGRARHVITENQRVLDAVAALRAGDAAAFGALCNASHASMRDDYQITTPDIDTLVTTAQQRRDVYGARMTGGGFGGAVVIVAHASATADTLREITEAYATATGRRAQVLLG